MATASESTGAAIDTAIQAATAEQSVCGGAALDETLALLAQAKEAFGRHEASEDHVTPAAG